MVHFLKTAEHQGFGFAHLFGGSRGLAGPRSGGTPRSQFKVNLPAAVLREGNESESNGKFIRLSQHFPPLNAVFGLFQTSELQNPRVGIEFDLTALGRLLIALGAKFHHNPSLVAAIQRRRPPQNDLLSRDIEHRSRVGRGSLSIGDAEVDRLALDESPLHLFPFQVTNRTKRISALWVSIAKPVPNLHRAVSIFQIVRGGRIWLILLGIRGEKPNGSASQLAEDQSLVSLN